MLNSSTAGAERPAWGIGMLVLIVVLVGIAAALQPPLVYLACALAVVVLASKYVEPLAVAVFWTLPYMAANLPTGVFTIKLPEVTAYTFGAAVIARAVVRRERLSLPPATWAVFLFLGVCAISTAWRLPAAIPYVGDIAPTDRNSPDVRSISAVIWMSISWMVVVGLYNVIGARPNLFRRCIASHCLGGGLASLVSLVIYGLSFAGFDFANLGGAGITRNLVPKAGDFFRLAGVAYEPLFLAFYLLTVIPVTLVIYLNYPDWLPRRLSGLSLALQCTAITLTFSTGGLVGLFVAVVLLVPVLRQTSLPKPIVRRFMIALAVFAAISICTAVAVNGFFDEVTAAFFKVGTDVQRRGEIAVGLSLFERFPWLGAGPAMSAFYFPKYNPFEQSQGFDIGEVNNIVLSTLGEVGVIGFIALTLCVLAGMYALLSTIRRYGAARTPIIAALTASLVGTAIQAQSTGMITLSFIYFTGIVGLALASCRCAPYVFDVNSNSDIKSL